MHASLKIIKTRLLFLTRREHFFAKIVNVAEAYSLVELHERPSSISFLTKKVSIGL